VHIDHQHIEIHSHIVTIHSFDTFPSIERVVNSAVHISIYQQPGNLPQGLTENEKLNEKYNWLYRHSGGILLARGRRNPIIDESVVIAKQ
jgi:hypothetical protein